ncbi:MAG: DUF503 domain-containing protein [Bacillota bacterium]|nr:DUF503 domain-containing protein [Bacillota bacterium]
MSGLFVGVLRAEIVIPGSASLKDKRRVLRSLIERVRGRFGVSCAELGAQDLWQRSVVGVACISGSSAEALETVENVLSWMERQDDFEVIGVLKEVR